MIVDMLFYPIIEMYFNIDFYVWLKDYQQKRNDRTTSWLAHDFETGNKPFPILKEMEENEELEMQKMIKF